MRPFRFSSILVVLTVSVLLSALSQVSAQGARTNHLVHRLDVVVGTKARPIKEGKLIAVLYTVDPMMADSLTHTLDTQEVLFNHLEGVRTIPVTLTGDPPKGFNTSLSVNGYEKQNGKWKRILWAMTFQEVPLPAQIEMELLPEYTPEAKRLAESLEDWLALKKANGGAYRFEIRSTGIGNNVGRTTLEVRANRVVVRAFEHKVRGDVVESWTERGKEVGSHEVSGELARTVDMVYGTCGGVLTESRVANTVTLNLQADGILESCYEVAQDCGSDCKTGLAISNLRFLDKNAAGTRRR